MTPGLMEILILGLILTSGSSVLGLMDQNRRIKALEKALKEKNDK